MESLIRSNNRNLPPWDMQLLYHAFADVNIQTLIKTFIRVWQQNFVQVKGDQVSRFMAPILDSAFNYMSTVQEVVKRFENQPIVTLDRSVVRTILAFAFLCNVPDQHLAKDSSINFNRCKSTIHSWRWKILLTIFVLSCV